MNNIEEIMATCPLKHDIRERLWEKYVSKLGKRPIKYLTLYCPPLMDVKHFCKKGYVVLKDGVYKGVVGVTDESLRGYSQTISEGEGRLELLKDGALIHELLERNEKDLIEKFAFDVINLDYCNHIYGTADKQYKQYISNNLQDVISIIEMQHKKNAGEFVLFITTRTDRSRIGRGFASSFTRDLRHRIDLNVNSNSNFENGYRRIFGSKSWSEICNTKFKDFITVGIVKLVSMQLAKRKFTIANCDTFWLHRDTGSFPEDFLHVALLVRKGNRVKYSGSIKHLYQIGTTAYLEGGAAIILDKIINSKIVVLKVSNDKVRLQGKYGRYIESLRENFELKIPRSI